MAIVQISRITNRKGLAVDLPQPLAGAELGWAIDERRLFIGNGELSEGAPVVGNTEILTEFSDVLEISNYTYQGLAGGYTVQTGPTPGNPVVQTIQARLDSYAVATDFGIVGDGSTDNTTAINRALYQLYCIDINPAVRRSLFFPAGVYVICDFLKIPAYATLYGEGTGGTIIQFRAQQWTNAMPWNQGTLVVDDNGRYYRAKIQVPIGVSISNTSYWTEENPPEYIWRTADSKQQIGANIATNSALPPADISILDIQFTTDVLLMDGCLLQDVNQLTMSGVTFTGPMTNELIVDLAENTVKTAGQIQPGFDYVIDYVGTTDFTLIGAASNTVGLTFTATGPGSGTGLAAIQHPDTAAIRWSSTEALVTQNIKIDNCGASGFWRVSNTEQQIKGVSITNSTFGTLYEGIYLGGDAPVNGGPSGVRIMHNTFDNIYWTGVVIKNCRFNATGYNTFYDVANEFNGYTFPSAPVIDIYTSDNLSVGDLFQRSADNIVWAHEVRIRIWDTRSIAFDGTDRLLLGTYQRAVGVTANLATSASSATLFTVDTAFNKAINVDYTMTHAVGNTVSARTGTMTVVSSTDGTNDTITINDNYFENNPVGGSLWASEADNVISILYSTTTSNVKISYSVTRLA